MKNKKKEESSKELKEPKERIEEKKEKIEAPEELIKYIENRLQRLVPFENIQAQLLKVGWSEEVLKYAFSSINTDKVKSNVLKSYSELESFIATALKKGFTDAQIRKLLENVGWQEDEVIFLLDKIKLEQTEGKKADTGYDKLIKPIDRFNQIQNKKVIDTYSFSFRKIPVKVSICQIRKDPSLLYEIDIPILSRATELILEELRLRLIREVEFGTVELGEGDYEAVSKKIKEALIRMVDEEFPRADEHTKGFLISYLVADVLGMGKIEILKEDDGLEEIAVNGSEVPVYVYHRKHGWCKTNLMLKGEAQILQYASMIARHVGREITTLNPLLDAHLDTGDRVNATIEPITTCGHTMTIRKFTKEAWTITKFLKNKTIDINVAAWMWLAIQFELSSLIIGGTASGKTSALNVLVNFIPPKQRIISIEDTREISLPSYMHWVPMLTRQPNPEGKGGIEMGDLLVNSLRMRPDRIIVGEVRRSKEAQTLFEAIHTGHSVYATLHADNADEAVTRLINPPINVAKTMIPAIALFIVQYRNRRTGLRRTFQLAETTKDGDANVLYQLDVKKDKLVPVNKSQTFFNTLQLFTGCTMKELEDMIAEKVRVLEYLVKNDITSVEDVGAIMAAYYTDPDYLFDCIAKNKRVQW